MGLFRFRNAFILGMFVLWPALILATDPQSGWLRGVFPSAAMASMAVFILSLGSKCMGLLFAWAGYKAFRDYIESDNLVLFRQVLEKGSTAAGLALIANAIVLAVMVFVFCYMVDAVAPAAMNGAMGALGV